jgi:aspartate/methionine/tyrosine aminotransferase
MSAEYKVTAEELRAAMERDERDGVQPIKGIILSSPSNPTGAMLTGDELAELAQLCEAKGADSRVTLLWCE